MDYEDNNIVDGLLDECGHVVFLLSRLLPLDGHVKVHVCVC